MGWAAKALAWWTRYVGVIALPIFIGVILLAWVQPVPPADWFCRPHEACIREWISALGGWFGAAGAIAAALATIAVMQKQLDAQQRQLDFQLGDAPPTAYLRQSRGDYARITIDIQNWNRRPLRVIDIAHAASGDIFWLEYSSVHVNDSDADVISANRYGFHDLVVPARKSSEQPSTCEIVAFVRFKDGVVEDQRAGIFYMKLTVLCHLIDSPNRRVTIPVSMTFVGIT